MISLSSLKKKNIKEYVRVREMLEVIKYYMSLSDFHCICEYVADKELTLTEFIDFFNSYAAGELDYYTLQSIYRDIIIKYYFSSDLYYDCEGVYYDED